MDNANKQLQRVIAALVIVVIALVMVVMHLTYGGLPPANTAPLPIPSPQASAALPVKASVTKASVTKASVTKASDVPAPSSTNTARHHRLTSEGSASVEQVRVKEAPKRKPVIRQTETASLLTPADVDGKTGPQLRLIRNTIYARHGYQFRSKDLRAFFAADPWYQPDTGNMKTVEGRLSATEAANIDLLKQA